MSAGLLSGVAGAAVGFAIGGPTGALYGYSIGSAAGSILFGPKLPSQQGPRLQDLSIQSSAEGQPIFKIYGDDRTAGNVFWGKPLTEHKKKKKSGGKGGGGGQKITTYTYTVDFALGLCEGPITGIVKIWADGKLIYDVSPLTPEEQAIVDAGGFVPGALERFQASFGKTTNIADTSGTMRIYSGSETQLPDPLIESDLGAGNTPAYRGLAYIVFDNLALADFGNRIPNITAEVIVAGSTDVQFLGKIGPLDTRVMPSPLYPSDARAITWSHYAKADKLLAVSGWSHNYATVDFVAGEPITVYPSGTIGYGTRGTIQGDGNTAQLPAFCDVPAFFCVSSTSSNAVLRLYTVSGNEAPVLIGSFQPEDQINGFGDLDNVNASVVHYVAGEVWVFRSSTGKVYAAPPQASLVPMPIKGNLNGLYSGALRSVFIGEEEIYALSGSANPYTLTVVDKATFTVLRSASIPISPSAASSAQPATRMYSDSAGQVWFLYLDVAGVTRLYYLDGAAGREYGVVPNYPIAVSNTFTFSVSGGLLTIFENGQAAINSYEQDQTPSIGKAYYWSIEATGGNAVPLSTIVADICDEAGLDSSFVNVTDLAGTMVRGYIRNAQMTARAALEPLASGFFFDAVESADKIVFKHRGGASVATIAYDDLGASSESSQADRVVTTITQDNELPIELNMQYADPARDFQLGSQRSRRQIPKSQKIDTVQMPISWSGTEAKQAVEKLHYTAWDDRTTYAFSLPAKYLRLEPADVVMLPVNGVLKRVMLTKTIFDDVLKCEAKSDYAANYVSESIAADNPAGPQQISVPGTTIMQILDIPILQDSDNDAGFYVAAMGTGSGWSGAVIYKSSDNVSFDEADSVTVESTMGSAMSLLPAGPTTIWDDGSTVAVRLIEGELTSTTDLGAMAGVNTIAIGAPGRWEIVSFRTATLNPDGTYTLSRLLRGRLGTEWAVGTHAIGDTVVLLEAGALIRIVQATSDIGVERYYKAISFGGDEADTIAYTHRAVGLETHAPVHIAGRRHSPAANDWTITWIRRGRVDNAWRDYVDVPLGETTENYEIDIMSGSTVKRTLTATSQTVTYTSAMQTADFGAVQATITVNIFQLSGVVGRGYVGTKTL